MSINCERGVKVQEYSLDKRNVLNRNIVIYGQTGSGKTVITKQIIKEVADNVAFAMVVCPTEPSHKTYSKFIPKSMIHTSLKADRIDNKNAVDKFIEWQTKRARNYSNAREYEVVSSIYSKNPSSEEINKILHDFVSKGQDSTTDIATYKDRVSEIIYRYIIKNIDDYKNLSNLSDADKYFLKYIDMNPNVLLVFDDCGAELKTMFKGRDSLKKIFNQGRHLNITCIVICQSVTDLESHYRKNARIVIFTDAPSVKNAMTNKSNGYTKDQSDTANCIISKVFSEQYRKLIFLTDENGPQFKYYTSSNNNISMIPHLSYLVKNIEKSIKDSIIDNGFFN